MTGWYSREGEHVPKESSSNTSYVVSKPVVAVTMGDPSGIGPEVAVKAALDAAVRRACRVVIVGDTLAMERARAIRWPTWESSSAPHTDATVAVDTVTRLKPAASRPGRATRSGGEASYRYILRAVELIGAGGADAMATAPINKKALNDAGHAWPGHTEAVGRPHPHAGSSDDAVRVAFSRWFWSRCICR